MMTVELLPTDEHNQRTINQSHPPNWRNPSGGTYDLFGYRRWPGRVGRRTHGRSRLPPRRHDGEAVDRRYLRQLWLHAKQGADPLRSRRLRD
jgi:hypothetical protein